MKDIKGYEGRYKITSDGRVWSCPKRLNEGHFHEGMWLKTPQNQSGYLVVCLLKKGQKGKGTAKSVHRLVAEAYLENPLEYEQVNHINGIRNDNRVENLEWCTREYNVRDGWARRLARERVSAWRTDFAEI